MNYNIQMIEVLNLKTLWECYTVLMFPREFFK